VIGAPAPKLPYYLNTSPLFSHEQQFPLNTVNYHIQTEKDESQDSIIPFVHCIANEL
jgi:hypothetical protein